MDIGDIIKTFRTKQGMSQEKLAEKLQLSKSAISNYEMGIRLPDFETIKKAKSILNIPTTVLMEEQEMQRKHKPFFTKEDFVRFIAAWEEGYDICKKDLIQEGDTWSYMVYDETPYYFELSNGDIRWIRSDWDSEFIQDFYTHLTNLAFKKAFSKPQSFEVKYVNYLGSDIGYKEMTHIISGYEDDTEDELFILAAVKAVYNNESSLWCDGSNFKYRAIDTPIEKLI